MLVLLASGCVMSSMSGHPINVPRKIHISELFSWADFLVTCNLTVYFRIWKIEIDLWYCGGHVEHSRSCLKWYFEEARLAIKVQCEVAWNACIVIWDPPLNWSLTTPTIITIPSHLLYDLDPVENIMNHDRIVQKETLMNDCWVVHVVVTVSNED